jgi:hypothetical protein
VFPPSACRRCRTCSSRISACGAQEGVPCGIDGWLTGDGAANLGYVSVSCALRKNAALH